jgi:hypothetical protein
VIVIGRDATGYLRWPKFVFYLAFDSRNWINIPNAEPSCCKRNTSRQGRGDKSMTDNFAAACEENWSRIVAQVKVTRRASVRAGLTCDSGVDTGSTPILCNLNWGQISNALI